MKKFWSIMAVTILLVALAGCSQKTEPKVEVFNGKGDGNGGPVEVTLTKTDGVITDVQIVGAQETKGIGTLAIEGMPERIKEANGADVDIVTGATMTSQGIIYAVNNALNPEEFPYPAAE